MNFYETEADASVTLRELNEKALPTEWYELVPVTGFAIKRRDAAEERARHLRRPTDYSNARNVAGGITWAV